MPHLAIQHSANLAGKSDLQALCEALAEVLVDTGLFPLGGIRVRAISAGACAIADGHEDNCFADMVLRIGAGRTLEERKQTGEAILHAAEQHFRPLLDEPHFALSLEVVEIDPDLSWKVNSIHPRLKQAHS